MNERDSKSASATLLGYVRAAPGGGHVRIVNRTTLDLMKAFRGKGYRVIVEPDDGSPLYYLVEKGDPSLLANPTFVFLVGIPTSVITSLVGSWLYDRFRNRSAASKAPPLIAFCIESGGVSAYFSEMGEPISSEDAQVVFDLLRRRGAALNTIALAKSDRDTEFPLCLEHTSTIVGSAEVREDGRGLRATLRIHRDDVRARVQSGELRGLSIAGMVRRSECSICGHDYVDCAHIAGLDYDGVVCVNTIKDIALAEVSLVREPINSDCLMDLPLGDA